jgi:hypothetical protein
MPDCPDPRQCETHPGDQQEHHQGNTQKRQLGKEVPQSCLETFLDQFQAF